MNNNQPRIICRARPTSSSNGSFEQEVPDVRRHADHPQEDRPHPRLERAKVAVESYDERIDPVGACVGMKGSRIYSIVRRLRNENIDVVNYTTNPQLMIQRALNPAKISSITIDEGEEDSFGLSQARPGIAGHRQGRPEHPAFEDADRLRYRCLPRNRGGRTLHSPEFADEIDGWVIDALKACGCDGQERAGTARRRDRRPCRPGAGTGTESRRDTESGIRGVIRPIAQKLKPIYE